MGFAVEEVEGMDMQNKKIKAGKDEELAVRHWRDWAGVGGRGKHAVCRLTLIFYILMASRPI